MKGRSAPDTAIAAVDAANFALEGAQPNVVTLAGILAPGGFVDERGMPDVPRLRQLLAPRLLSAPALCRRPVQAGSSWRWEPAAPDLTRHVRLWDDGGSGAGAATTGSPELETVCAAVLMRGLSLDGPLWELLLVPGLAAGGCGVLFRVHHAVADGLEAESLIAALTDPQAGVDGPGPLAETVAAVRSADPSAVPPAAAAASPRRRGLLQRVGSAVEQTTAVFRRTVRSRVLLGPLGATREVAFLDVGLPELHDGAKRLGGTVGDAFLTAFGRGLGAVLAAAGEQLPATLPISCPVRLPRRSGAGNATGVMLVPVPVATTDVREALAAVAGATRSEKLRAREAGTFEWMAGPRSAALLMRFARRQRAVASIASEFPGPTRALVIGGAELVQAWPLALLSANVRVGVVGVSYAGRLRISVQVDAAHIASARLVADAMHEALDRIASAGGGSPVRPGEP